MRNLFLFAFLVILGGLFGSGSFAQVANLNGDVFIDSARIQLLKNRVGSHLEPNYSAYLVLKFEADAALNWPDQAPTQWYVPAYYVNPLGHLAARTHLMHDANA